MNIWKFIHGELKAGHKLMLLVVADVSGSTPGRPGYKMAVSDGGSLWGSIGGGVMEFNMVNIARQWLAEGQTEPLAIRQVHDPRAGESSSGLLCSGEQTNVFYLLDSAMTELVHALAKSTERGDTGTLYIQPDFMAFDPDNISASRIEWEMTAAADWSYTEHIGPEPVLYIFGGGHLSLALSQQFRLLGFRIKVFDDRTGINTMEMNTWAHEKHVIDYREAAAHVKSGAGNYVAIMTVSHAADQLILGQMLTKELSYLGMIGSSRKVKTIFEALRAAGATEEQLAAVDSPMGMPIHSQTVPEIAVSIAAKIIYIKNI